MGWKDRERWNTKYACKAFIHGRRPCRLLAEHVRFLPEPGTDKRALDIACGEGRNAVFLAQLGYQVDAVDISDVGLNKAYKLAIEKGVENQVRFMQADLEAYQIPSDDLRRNLQRLPLGETTISSD